MFRNTVLGLAAAVALAAGLATSASTASAGSKVQFHIGIGVPSYGYGYSHPAPYPVYGGHYPVRYHCDKVFVGYKKVWTSYGWKKRPMFRRECY